MSVYKVPQDVEAEDKFLGPLSFKQFIYGGVAAVNLYLSVISVLKHFPFAIAIFAPVIIVSGFLAFPWSREQTTEVWLAAKIRFLIKPRIRIWNQSGVKELVTITAPQTVVKTYTNGLSQYEVSSRLSALADLLDSRGWAVKNVDALTLHSMQTQQANDRLLEVGSAPKEVDDASSAVDILDTNSNQTAIHFDEMIRDSEAKHHQQIMNQLETARAGDVPVANGKQPHSQADFWFLQNNGTQPPGGNFPPDMTFSDSFSFDSNLIKPNDPASYNHAPTPVPLPVVTAADEQALLDKIHRMHEQPTYSSHLKTIQPLGAQQATSAPTPAAQQQQQHDQPQQSQSQTDSTADEPTATPASSSADEPTKQAKTTDKPTKKPADTHPPGVPVYSTSDGSTFVDYSKIDVFSNPELLGPAAPSSSKEKSESESPAQSVEPWQPPEFHRSPQSEATSAQPVTPPVDPAIMSLAANNDLSVETIARQANKDKPDDGEVVISLR